jgi:hypothetical protein
MKGALSLRNLPAARLVGALAGATLLCASGSAAAATSICASGRAAPPGRHFAGIVSARDIQSGCLGVGRGRTAGDAADGSPPLVYHGGPVMGTRLTGALVITPIYWHPVGHPMSAGYRTLINTYLSNVALASGATDNVYSIAPEYSGTNGAIRYRIHRGAPINDTGPLPVSGCRLQNADTSGIYADGTGYNSCLDDAQVIAETDRVVTANSLPRDYAHIYVMFLPKRVESCFYAGGTSTSTNFCTINHEPSAAFCAYHSQAASGSVYADMAYPIYRSATGLTCGTDANYAGVIETPNGNPDADTEVSLTSHETIEAWTDPDTETGWYDSVGDEIGDECAYVYGPTAGTAGALYNQTISGNHYLTQEEFSNNSFFQSAGGCLQGET